MLSFINTTNSGMLYELPEVTAVLYKHAELN